MLIAAYYFALIITAVILKGVAVMLLWGWFAVPLFGLPALSLSYALGLVELADALLPTPQTLHEKKEEKQPMVKPVAHVFLRPSLGIFTGWIISHFL